MPALYFISPDEDWVRSGSLSASSTMDADDYPASNGGTDDPSRPWWAAGGSASITVDLGGTQSVGSIGLIMTNADAGNVITVTGLSGGSTTLTGSRTASGFPVDLMRTFDPAQTASSITFSIAGNSNAWSVGRVVVGGPGYLNRNYLQGKFTPEPFRLSYSDENDFGHEIRYDLGVEGWRFDGGLRLFYTGDLATLDALWFATRGGVLPTMFWPNYQRYPPVWARMTKSLPRTDVSSNFANVDLFLKPESRGVEVIG